VIQGVYKLCIHYSKTSVKKKIKQTRYKPGVAQRVPGSYSSQISWQRQRMVVSLSALDTSLLYPQEIHMVLISVRGWVDPRALVRPEGLCHWKIPMTPSGIEPATSRFLLQSRWTVVLQLEWSVLQWTLREILEYKDWKNMKKELSYFEVCNGRCHVG